MKTRGQCIQTILVILCASIPNWTLAEEVPKFEIKKNHKSFQTEESKAKRRNLFNQDIEDAVTRGLKYLIEQQKADGFFLGGAIFQENVATTAYAGQAFLMAGNIWKNKDYQFAVDRAAAFLISQQAENGLILKNQKHLSSAIYGHGIALQFLAKYAQVNSTDELRKSIQRAAKFSMALQQSEGSWGYEFKPGRVGRGDVSNTACQIAALLAVRDAGIEIGDQVFEKTASYFDKARKVDGGFLYVITYDSSSTYQRTAAVMASWPRLPNVESNGIVKAYAFMDQKLKPYHTNAPYYNYAMTYGIDAYRHRGSDAFCEWYASISQALLSLQGTDGSWNVNHVRLGKTFGTATACMILQSALFNPGKAKAIKRK